MPIYEYQCPHCPDELVEVFKNLSERDEPELCSRCGSPMGRVFSVHQTKTPKERIKDPGPGRRPAWV